MESMEPSEAVAVEDNNLFVIDTQGDTTGQDIVVQDVPVKKLKRRNAAMYAQTDWLFIWNKHNTNQPTFS